MRIAIANDSASLRNALQRTITESSTHEVIWTASSGSEALERCRQEHPDALLLDIIMQDMTGVEATRQIMAATPCAIVMLNDESSDQTASIFDALGAGALDAVSLPADFSKTGSSGQKLLLRKLDLVSRLTTGAAKRKAPASAVRGEGSGLVTLGASAGGPAALATVLGSLPKEFPAPVIVVQHVDPQFASGLATWLAQQCQLQVRLAEEGDIPQPGLVLVAAREDHLVFTSGNKLGYTRAAAETSYRPSVDVFLKSVDRFWTGSVVAVLLTGMGRDGAEGLRLLRSSGHHTIAQNRQTSAVYGMPKAAAELNAATEILALDKIGLRLAHLFPAIKKQ